MQPGIYKYTNLFFGRDELKDEVKDELIRATVECQSSLCILWYEWMEERVMELRGRLFNLNTTHIAFQIIVLPTVAIVVRSRPSKQWCLPRRSISWLRKKLLVFLPYSRACDMPRKRKDREHDDPYFYHGGFHVHVSANYAANTANFSV